MKALNLTTLLFLILLGSCKKEVQQQTEEQTLQSVSNARAGNSTVYLRVTVEPINGTTSSQILSDGSDYIHGSQQVEAQILSSDGNFYMQTNTTFKTPVRTLLFPFNPSRLEGKTNYRLRTTCTTWLQNMDLNGGTQTIPFRVWGNVGKGTLDWNMRFDNGQDAVTDYAIVTRLDANTWTIEPANVSAIPANARLTDGSGANIDDGYDVVPFKLTLKRK